MNNLSSNLTLDVVIPCYNAATTLQRAAYSVLSQQACRRLYLVDDGSTDDTPHLIKQLSCQHPEKITALFLPKNTGVAAARNWGAFHSTADLIAFLDADDTYEMHALDIIPNIFTHLPTLSLIRLKLTPINLPDKYLSHPKFQQAWDFLQMTVGGNTIFRRNLFLASGGFPQDAIFRRLGGEDGALGLAFVKCSSVGTLFDEIHAGVQHHYHENMHAKRLLDFHLFHQSADISHSDIAHAEAVTERICQQLNHLKNILNEEKIGKVPLLVEYANE